MRIRKYGVIRQEPTEELNLLRTLADSMPMGVVSVVGFSISWHNAAFSSMIDPEICSNFSGENIHFITNCSIDEKKLLDLVSSSSGATHRNSSIIKCERKNGQPFLAQFNFWSETISGDTSEKIFLVLEISQEELGETLNTHMNMLQGISFEDTIDGTLLIMGSRIVNANDRLHEMLGYPKGSLLGAAHWKIYHPDFQRELRERVKARFSSDEQVSSYELIIQKCDGSILPALGFDRKVLIDGHPGLSVRLRDISDIKALESRRMFEDRIEYVNSVMGSVANDFNNILMIIMGCAQFMYNDPNVTVAQMNNLQRIIQASERAKDLVGQMLVTTRRGRLPQGFSKLSMVVADVMKITRDNLPSNVHVFQRIETNLDVAVFFDESAREEMSSKLPDHVHHLNTMNLPILISVRDADDSPDVPSLQRERAWPKSVQLDVSVLESDKANGLIHRSSITVSKGSFKPVPNEPDPFISGFHMRLRVGETLNGSLESTPRTRMHGSERILLVDDDVTVVETIKQMLEPLGYIVTCAFGSIEALSVFRNDPHLFDIVLTDMAMPKMTGLFLARELIKLRADVPIIVLTGFIADISMNEAKSIGIDTVLTKPFSQFRLASAIRETLDSKGAAHHLSRQKN